MFLSTAAFGAVTAPDAGGKLVIGFDGSEVVVDGSSRVTQWTDQIGDNDALSTTAAPYLQTVNTGNGLHPVVSFNGNCFLKTNPFTTPLSQRNAIFVVSSRIGLKNDYIFDGTDVTNRHGLVSRANFTYGMVAAKQIINENVSTTINSDPNKANYVEVFTLLFNGATSEMRINGTRVLFGDVGNVPLGGLTLGAWYNGTSAFNGKIAEFLVYNGTLTGSEVLEVENYLRYKYQLSSDANKASNPFPDYAQTIAAATDVELSWTAGASAVSHNVYFGENQTNVAAATPANPLDVYQGNQAAAAFETQISLGRTYYWRVDEVDASSQVTTGDVWPFVVADNVPVENFDQYANESAMLANWSATGGAVAMLSTADYISYLNSMAINYSNTSSPYYSACVRTFSPAADFTVLDMAAIDVKVKGSATNTNALLYMSLSDGVNIATQYIDSSLVTVQSTGWVTRRFALSGFTGVDPSNIVSMTIGVGDGTDPGQTVAGEIMVDAIMLYPVRCLGGYPVNDINKDCIIDMADFAGMAATWFDSGLWPSN